MKPFSSLITIGKNDHVRWHLSGFSGSIALDICCWWILSSRTKRDARLVDICQRQRRQIEFRALETSEPSCIHDTPFAEHFIVRCKNLVILLRHDLVKIVEQLFSL